MDISLYTLMFSIQFYYYYLIFQNENFKKLLYDIIKNYKLIN